MQEKKIGEIIAEAREKAGYSQRQLAKEANISNAELSKIESGEREVPNPKTLRKISKFINVNYNDMMYKIGLGMEVSTLNPFNSTKLVNACKENLEKKNILESEKELLLHTIEDTEYQINTSREIVNLIQSLKVKERNKNAKK